MGSCFSSNAASAGTEVPSSTAAAKVPTSTASQEPKTAAAPPAPKSTAQNAVKETVYYDSVMTEEEMERLAERLFDETHCALIEDYAPARIKNPFPRSSIVMADPDTLLMSPPSDITKKKQRETVIVKQGLTTPAIRLELEGYPGDLTPSELENCLEFRNQLKSRPLYYEMVHAWDGVEEEPYALCRFLRARQFDPQKVLAMMEETMPLFETAHSEKFYPNIEEALGCPQSVFLSQYPYFYSGVAKNGCPVAYFRAGQVSVEGIDCCTDMDTKLVKYLWHGLKYIFPTEVSKLPSDEGRCEVLFVVDLAGLTASMLNSRTIGLFKKLSEATSSFPEVLNKTVVLNAPAYFSFSWRIMKGFLHPRTAAKIEIYRDSAKKRLLELIDEKELLSDYGGVSESFEQISKPKGVVRRVNELLVFSQKGASSKVVVGTLSSEEQMNVSVFSRSKCGANVSVVSGSGVAAEAVVAPPQGQIAPHYSATVAKQIQGPGMFTVNVKTRQSTRSAEYFLIIVDVVASSER